MRTRIVILGAGFGGLYTALALDRHLPPEADVTLIDRQNFFLFTPFLTEVAGSSIDTRHIVNPIRRMVRRVQFAEATVESIDFEGRAVRTRLPDQVERVFPYDHLVLALGGITTYFGMEGVARYAWSLKTLGDAIALRNHLIAMLEQADVMPAEARGALLTLVVAGGGLTGIEAAGDLNDLVREAAQLYRSIRPEEIRVVVVEGGPRLAAELSPRLGVFARKALEQQGVEVRLDTLVREVGETQCHLANGEVIATRTVVWTAGAAPNPLSAALPLPHDARGRILVDPNLQVRGHEHLWALGDAAAVPDILSGGIFSPTAQNAIRQGAHLAANLLAVCTGRPVTPFRYRMIGQLAALGHRKGVGTIGPIKLSGFAAWFVWRTYYLYRLPRFEKRLRVALDWTLDLIFGRDIVQLSTVRTHPAGEETGVLR